MIRYVFAVLVATFMLFQVQPGYSQSAEEFKALKDEVKALKEGQQAIQKDIQDIKNSLKAQQKPPAPPEFKEAVVSIEGASSKGDKDAKVALIEFSDYQ